MKVVLIGLLAVVGIAVFVVLALAHGEGVCREISDLFGTVLRDIQKIFPKRTLCRPGFVLYLRAGLTGQHICRKRISLEKIFTPNKGKL